MVNIVFRGNEVWTTTIIIVILFILFNLKKKNIKWNLFLCLGLFPYIYMLLKAIYTFFRGSGLVGDVGGFNSALFAIVMYLINFWYIFIPALLLIILSIYKKHKQK